jgi:hypothetical protein
MTAWRQAIELSIGDEDVARLVTITRSRTEPASRVERARMLLAYVRHLFSLVFNAVPPRAQTPRQPTWLRSVSLDKTHYFGFVLPTIQR